MNELLNVISNEPVVLSSLLLNLLICILLSTSLAWFYARFGRSFSNRQTFAHTLPVVALTTVVIIQIIQSSLAISLGLVGALSIVRFRTAIKEPEELAYMFLSITIGLGLGANQRIPTIVSFIIILLFIFIRNRFFAPQLETNNLFFDLQTPSDTTLLTIEQILAQHTTSATLRRLDSTPTTQHLTFLILLKEKTALNDLLVDFRAQIPSGQFSIIDQINALGG